MKRHRKIKIALLCVVVLIVIVLAGAWSMFGQQLRAAGTVEQLEDDLYTMEYDGDYGFDAFLQQGGASTDEELANYIASFLSHGFWKPEMTEVPFGCSTLTVQTAEGGTLFGRNFDWETSTGMIVRTWPDNGYASISTCNLDYLGFGEGWKPEGMGNQMMALAAIYVPLDGMNEAGLCIADLMAGDTTETHQDTDRPDLTTGPMIRLLLDHAANVEEAVALLEQYDMNSSIGSAHHMAISDAEGNAVVVEYIDNEMHVTETPVVTNFYLTEGEKYGTGSEQSKTRYETLCDLREKAGGVLSAEQVRDALQSVAQSNYPDGDATQWSIVFDTQEKTADYYFREQFGSAYSFALNGTE